jgi:glycosyltransferase involved in cell wall biosynthesis
MTVLYYTSPSYLDTAIELINVLKKHVDLHVLIEIAPRSKVRNILEVDNLITTQSIIGISELLKKENYKYLEPYFDGCKSANFIVHTHESGSSFSTIKISYIAWKYIKIIRPDIIHIEAMSLRSLGLVPFIFSSKKIFITVHDGIPHSGERNWKESLPRFLYLKIPYSKGYFFYSKFSKIQFEQYYKKDKYPKFVMRMYPSTYFKMYIKENLPERKHILFFGRLSTYKGIDVFLKAIPLVLNEFKSELFVIAGRSIPGYNLDINICEKHKNHITVLNRYIPNEELVNLIQASKFVVCPYLDATQSGVLMTSYALNTPVIASSVGAFPEYIEQNVTGILVPVNDPAKLADAIKLTLQNNFYETMEESISRKNKTNMWTNNKDIILNAYLS